MSALPGTTGRRRIYLMRHGHVDYLAPAVVASGKLSDVPLTGVGRAQARAAGRALASVRFDVAVSSGYPRTVETMDLVLAENEGPVPPHERDADLVEIKGGGIPRVKSPREISALMAFEFERAAEPDAKMFAAGEAFADAYARTVRGVTRLIE